MHAGDPEGGAVNLVNSVTEREQSTPKTSLGFYNIFIGIVFSGGSVLTISLTLGDVPTWAVVSSGGATLALVTAAFATVATLNVRSPEKLMLGQVSARDFHQITQSRATLGDARSGMQAIQGANADSSGSQDVIDAETVEEDL